MSAKIRKHADILFTLKCLSGVWGFCIFEIFGYSWEKLQYILSAEKFIFIDYFAVKVDGYDVKPGICLYENICRGIYSWVDVTSVNFNNKKVLEDKIFGCQDILKFFSWASEDFKYVKSPTPDRHFNVSSNYNHFAFFGIYACFSPPSQLIYVA